MWQDIAQVLSRMNLKEFFKIVKTEIIGHAMITIIIFLWSTQKIEQMIQISSKLFYSCKVTKLWNCGHRRFVIVKCLCEWGHRVCDVSKSILCVLQKYFRVCHVMHTCSDIMVKILANSEMVWWGCYSEWVELSWNNPVMPIFIKEFLPHSGN